MNYTNVIEDMRQDTFCNLVKENERERTKENDHYGLYHNIRGDHQ